MAERDCLNKVQGAKPDRGDQTDGLRLARCPCFLKIRAGFPETQRRTQKIGPTQSGHASLQPT
jgi:hypothetical protein